MRNDHYKLIIAIGPTLLAGIILYALKLYFLPQPIDKFLFVGYIVVYILHSRVHRHAKTMKVKESMGIDTSALSNLELFKKLDLYSKLGGFIMLVPLLYTGFYGIYKLFGDFIAKALFFTIAILVNSYLVVKHISNFNGRLSENYIDEVEIETHRRKK